ncbi:MAG: metal ABC transporter ATP-binding protein [Alphaproteobacteria bacterium]
MNASPDICLNVENLSVSYQNQPALIDVSFSLPTASLTAVIGANGAGKSTLVKAMVGLVAKEKGKVLFWNQALDSIRQRITYIPQRAAVDWQFPVSAAEVVGMGLYRQRGWLRGLNKQDKEKAHAALEAVGLADFARRSIGALSGGQQQRAFFARALVQQADCYIMDEPLAGVDAASEELLFKLMLAEQQKGKTIICVHHHLPSVPQYFSHAVILNRHLYGCGTVKEVFTPAILQQAYAGQLLFG